MNKSRTITGIAFILLGVFLVGISIFNNIIIWSALIYGVVFIVLGVLIFLNKKEDEIEKIKDDKLN